MDGESYGSNGLQSGRTHRSPRSKCSSIFKSESKSFSKVPLSSSTTQEYMERDLQRTEVLTPVHETLQSEDEQDGSEDEQVLAEVDEVDSSEESDEEVWSEDEEKQKVSPISKRIKKNGKIQAQEVPKDIPETEIRSALQALQAHGRKHREAESKKTKGDLQETCVSVPSSELKTFRSYAHVNFGCLNPGKRPESMFGLLCRLHRDGKV